VHPGALSTKEAAAGRLTDEQMRAAGVSEAEIANALSGVKDRTARNRQRGQNLG
jgi:hypothetical protein